MAKQILLKPIDMTEAVMADLEQRGLIIRLRPNRHALAVQPGTARGESIYESDAAYGAHKLITVTIDRPSFSAFGAHPDNEEFLFIGDPATKPLFLAVCIHREEALAQKISARDLGPDDFRCLRVTYNDPEVSFFTMLGGVPHGEAVANVDGRPASFYVTEPCSMGIRLTDFGECELLLPRQP